MAGPNYSVNMWNVELASSMYLWKWIQLQQIGFELLSQSLSVMMNKHFFMKHFVYSPLILLDADL